MLDVLLKMIWEGDEKVRDEPLTSDVLKSQTCDVERPVRVF